MIKRLLSFLVGIGLIIGVIFLGMKTRTDQSLVIWFGLASAILVPAGFAAIGYAFAASNRQVLERLSKVPEIEKLITEAKSQEEKIRLLEQERSRLVQVVELEARKQSLITRKESLEKDGVRMLKELEAIDAEISGLDINIEASPVLEEIKRLQARLDARRRGDIVIRFGSSYFTLNRDLFLSIPFGGVVYEYFRMINIVSGKIIKFTGLIFRKKARSREK